MNSNTRLSCAIAAILGGSYMGPCQAATPADAGNSEGIQEIVVTAQRRAQNLQDVPITIQALTADTLTELNVTTFDQFVKYLPNVTQAGAGPGQNNIFMRGLSIGAQGSQSSGIVGQIPNVAVYLDDQSAALPSRNLDVYAADIERIEVLEGPQGTLFGSGAEAGVLRYITNKPKLDVTEGNVNAGYSYTAHGDANSNVDATINLPLISDTLAIRAVIYDDSRGGYINNVPGTFTRASTDLGIARGNGGVVPTDSVTINNDNIAGSAINPVSYQGFRLSLLYKLNDDWNALLAQSYQNMNAQGVFYQMPYASEGTTFDATGKPVGSEPLPPRSVTLFNPSYDKDKFENTALTINGRVGDLKLVYSGGYLVRNVEQVQDYTNYSRGVFGYYYQCAGYSATSAAAGKCYTPSATWRDTEKNTHQSHELRLSTPDDWRIRAIGGLYYEQFVISDDSEFLYRSVPTCSPTVDVNCFNPVRPFAGSYTSNPSIRNDSTGFLDDVQRTIDQKAAFGSIDVDLIPKQLTLTLGTRYYRFNEKEIGGDVGSFYCKVFTPTTYFGPCLAPYGTNLNTQNPNTSKYTGFRSRANLSWKVTGDALIYYTWSQGFRPGGFNRGTSGHLPTTPGDPTTNQFITPATFSPDSLTNNELGFKTLWFDRRFEINGALYQEDWHNAQVNFFDPQGGLGNLTFATNGADYRVRGLELQLVVKPFEGLTIQGSSAWNSSNQQNSPYLINNNPTSPGYGQPLTSIPNPYGPINSPLANSPPVQFSFRVRDDIPLGDYHAFVQAGGQHIGNSYSATGNLNSYDQPGYTTYDAAAGVSKDAWNVQLFVQNLTDVNASTYTSANPQVEAQVVTRPRVAGIRFGYRF
ncbi:MAG TPA: TonB-dependent receptor [Steroidobacteraceae bacterium]|nr:TonB-dependent receptor [Steroidobacteraceae bacterium]